MMGLPPVKLARWFIWRFHIQARLDRGVCFSPAGHRGRPDCAGGAEIGGTAVAIS